MSKKRFFVKETTKYWVVLDRGYYRNFATPRIFAKFSKSYATAQDRAKSLRNELNGYS